jgi:hypothetical protein
MHAANSVTCPVVNALHWVGDSDLTICSNTFLLERRSWLQTYEFKEEGVEKNWREALN